jgi:hypothetical protein
VVPLNVAGSRAELDDAGLDRAPGPLVAGGLVGDRTDGDKVDKVGDKVEGLGDKVDGVGGSPIPQAASRTRHETSICGDLRERDSVRRLLTTGGFSAHCWNDRGVMPRDSAGRSLVDPASVPPGVDDDARRGQTLRRQHHRARGESPGQGDGHP